MVYMIIEFQICDFWSNLVGDFSYLTKSRSALSCWLLSGESALNRELLWRVFPSGSDTNLREQIRAFRFDAGSDAMSFRIIRGELARRCHALVNVFWLNSAVSVIQIRVSVNRSECWDLFSQCDVVLLVLAGNSDATPYCLVAR
ncbi:hypothetical protein F511_14576 [Dorcoceras hygrometricum]|uniref:Uncharacterized protein n=1 Tax=Dorcoceras hygrometricum TaxID=472368 RepID=A0A2Z7AML6_9LAMI|nr:hypothetical protein F511_14576 [Dorcoceras hygrometricum]